MIIQFGLAENSCCHGNETASFSLIPRLLHESLGMRSERRVLTHWTHRHNKCFYNNFAHDLPHSKRMLCVCRSSSCTDCRDIPISSPAGRARVQSRRSGLKEMKQAVELDQSLTSPCFQVLCQLLLHQLLHNLHAAHNAGGHWPVWSGLRCAWYSERNFCCLDEHVCE